MVKGLYSAYTGMLTEQKRLDIISNNVANAATVGYKKEGVTNQSFKEMLTVKLKDKSVGSGTVQAIGNMSLGTKIGEVYTDYDQGSFQQTNNTYDLAIQGNGFFKIAFVNANGEESYKYTRAGNFIMDTEGYIKDADGHHVMGENGYLQVDPGAANVVIDQQGRIYADGQYADTVEITDFEDYNYLKKYGDTMYETVDGAVEKDASATVQQGYVEQSNVSAVKEMINMINITRTYETSQKAIQTIDSMLDKAVNSVGRL